MIEDDWDAPIGLTLTTPARTITRGEAGVVNSLLWTTGPLHTDAGAARAAGFADLSLPAHVAAAVAGGLWANSGLIDSLERDHGIRMLAILETRARYLHVVLVDDTVRLDVTLASATPSRSKPQRAVLVLEGDLVNQRGETAVKIEERILVARA